MKPVFFSLLLLTALTSQANANGYGSTAFVQRQRLFTRFAPAPVYSTCAPVQTFAAPAAYAASCVPAANFAPDYSYQQQAVFAAPSYTIQQSFAAPNYSYSAAFAAPGYVAPAALNIGFAAGFRQRTIVRQRGFGGFRQRSFGGGGGSFRSRTVIRQRGFGF